MEYKKLGKSDLSVSVIALGTWGLGGGSVWSDGDSTERDTDALLGTCREYGINYIDTAPVYGTARSEELLGKALKHCRNDFILQTKCSLNWRNEGGKLQYERDGYTVRNDTSARAIQRDVDDSLLRMGLDHIDSLIVHYVSPLTPVEETVYALEDLIRRGKIRCYGLSNSMPEDLEAYVTKAGPSSACGGASLVQEFFSILSPFHGREYFPACEKNGATFQTYGVLEEGFLTGPDFLSRKFRETDIRARIPWVGESYQEGLKKAFSLWDTLRKEHACSFSNLAEAWALSQFPNMSLLVGMRKPETVKDTVKALSLRLSPDEVCYMEDSVRSIQVPVLDK